MSEEVKIKSPITEDDIQEVSGKLPSYDQLPKVTGLVGGPGTKPLPPVETTATQAPQKPWLNPH